MTEDTPFTDDGFLGGRLRILQPKKGFRAGSDSVFLAAAVPATAGDAVFEAGLGHGVAALCLLARVDGCHVTGVELDGRAALLAEKNAARNGFASQLQVLRGDVRKAMRQDLAQWPRHGTFAHAFANPPYYQRGRIAASPLPQRAAAHAFAKDDLAAWIRVLAAMVRPRGTVSIIYPAASLDALLCAFARHLGDIRILPLAASPQEPAGRVIIQGVKASAAPVSLLPPLVLHRDGGGYTPEAENILRNGAPLSLR